MQHPCLMDASTIRLASFLETGVPLQSRMINRSTVEASPPWIGRTASAVVWHPAFGDDAVAATTAYGGVCVLLAVAPFERLQPIVRLPWQSISNVEAIVAIVFGVWLVAMFRSRAWPRWRTPLTGPWIVLLVTVFLSAAMAPTARMNALHMAGRLALGFAVFVLTINGASTPIRLRRAMGVSVGAGLIVSLLATLEYSQVNEVLRWLGAFRPDVTVVGAEVRAGGTLQYPTIASMYLEIVFALGLGLVLTAIDERYGIVAVALSAGLVVIGNAITLTFTRAGLLMMGLTLAFVGVARYSQRGFDRGLSVVTAIVTGIVLLFVLSHSTQSLRLRFTSEGQEAWYRAGIEAPERVALHAGARQTVPLRVTNTGRLVWDSRADPPIRLSYHWIAADSDRVVRFNGERTLLPEPVPPGTTIAINAQVRAPGQAGQYRLAWDVVQENRLWFSTEPGATMTFSRAEISEPGPGDHAVAEADGPGAPRTLPLPVTRPGRLVLWRAAARMLAAHPVLGIGPDNFRLLYGPYAGLQNADSRLHSNNMYIEMAAGAGLLGGLAFLWLTWAVVARIAADVQHAAATQTPCALGIAAAGMTVLLHGLVDSFLSFTPTYLLIALAFGFAVAGSSGTDA
jgi:hypothetical protein